MIFPHITKPDLRLLIAHQALLYELAMGRQPYRLPDERPVRRRSVRPKQDGEYEDPLANERE